MGRGAELSQEARERLATFRRDVEAALPGQVAAMRLFGSRARGDAGEESDYDVAVVLQGPGEHWRIGMILSDLAYPHILEGVYISPIPLSVDELENGGRTELAAEIIRDGIALP